MVMFDACGTLIILQLVWLKVLSTFRERVKLYVAAFLIM